MFIVHITYIKPAAIVAQFRPAHRAYLDTGYEKDYLIASGPKTTGDGGVLLSQLSDRATLENFIKHDPFNLEGVAQYELIEFNAVKFHKKFADIIS